MRARGSDNKTAQEDEAIVMKGVRVLFIGWDGAEPALVEPWTEQGKLPVLAELMGRGVGGRIRSTIPAVTPPAWTSMITGVDPGRHGIYSFTRPSGGDYGERLVTSAERQTPSVWRYLSEAGRRVGVFNLSLAYPPEPVNGFLVAGFDAPVFNPQICYPQAAFKIATQGISGYVHEGLGQMRDEVCGGELTKQMRQQRDMLFSLTDEIPVEVLAVNYNAPDHVHHHAWPLGQPAEKVLQTGNGAIEEVYQTLDSVLGDLLERYADEDTEIVLVSDHGGGRMQGHVSLAQALEEGGFLSRPSSRKADALTRLRRLARQLLPRGLKTHIWSWLGSEFRGRMAHQLRAGLVAEVDWSKTSAFPWGSSGFVQVNMRGREPQGQIAPQDRERVLADVEAYLCTLRDPVTGQLPVGDIWRGEEIYKEPRAGYPPDMIVEGAEDEYAVMPYWETWGPEYKGGVRNFTTEGDDFRGVSANHRPWGILAACGPSVKAGVEIPVLSMPDIGPLLLYLAGEPIPEGLDGRVEQLVWDTGEELRVEGWGRALPQATEPIPYSEEEQAAVEKRLNDLGYM